MYRESTMSTTGKGMLQLVNKKQPNLHSKHSERNLVNKVHQRIPFCYTPTLHSQNLFYKYYKKQ